MSEQGTCPTCGANWKILSAYWLERESKCRNLWHLVEVAPRAEGEITICKRCGKGFTVLYANEDNSLCPDCYNRAEGEPTMKALRSCVNGDGRPIQPPSKVLCKECFKELDRKFHALVGEPEAAAKDKP